MKGTLPTFITDAHNPITPAGNKGKEKACTLEPEEDEEDEGVGLAGGCWAQKKKRGMSISILQHEGTAFLNHCRGRGRGQGGGGRIKKGGVQIGKAGNRR